MKKLLAIVFTVAFIGSFSTAFATVQLDDQIEFAVEKCDKCGKEDCSGCKAESGKKKECSAEEKKACCSKGHGSKAKGGKAKSSETKSEEKTESKK